MNDFTKEELKELMNGVWCRHQVHKMPINQNIYDKIQSMIDNYDKSCEHKSTNYDDGLYYCDDCGVFVE